MHVKRSVLLTAAFLGVLLLGLVFVPVFATGDGVKVAVCHATGSDSNPYTKVVVSVHSVDDANGLNGHGDHGRDAWKPFEFDGQQYGGQNEDLFGELIDRDCNLIEPPEPVIELFNDCRGWRVKIDGESVEGGNWEDPFELEVAFSQVLDRRIREPEECLVVPTPEPGEVQFRVEASFCRDDKEPQRKVNFYVSPSNGGHIEVGGNSYGDGDSDFFDGGTLHWNGVPAEGFAPKDSGSISFSDCGGEEVPPSHPATGPADAFPLIPVAAGLGSAAVYALYRIATRKR